MFILDEDILMQEYANTGISQDPLHNRIRPALYPMPVTDVLNIMPIENDEILDLRIFNNCGCSFPINRVGKGYDKINVFTLSPVAYVFVFYASTGQCVESLVKD